MLRYNVNLTDTHPALKQRAALCMDRGEDEVLSGLTVLDRNLWMRIEEMQCVSQRLTCNMSVEPLVILAHYNIPERDISLESIGLFSRPQRCYTSAPTIVSSHLKN